MNKNIALVIAVASLVFNLGGCGERSDRSSGRSSAQPIETQSEGILSADRLIEIAIADFRAHRPPVPQGFRNVRYGITKGRDDTDKSILCGEFLAAVETKDDEWTGFATLQTDGYEQWLGAQASPLCQHKAIEWGGRDYAEQMKRKFDQ